MRTIRTMLVPLALAGTLLSPAISPAHAVAPPVAVMVDRGTFAPDSTVDISQGGSLVIVNSTGAAQTYTVGTQVKSVDAGGTTFTITQDVPVSSTSGATGSVNVE